ncbi:MAG: DNA gyrase inhibitor YacG [Planctomycetota bacterium]
MKHRCPICNKLNTLSTHDVTKESCFYPFCSQRCKLLDLGAWLDSNYRIVSKISSPDGDESVEPIQN